MDELREQIGEILAEYTKSGLMPDEAADKILALPRIAEAFEALQREEGYSSIYDD